MSDFLNSVEKALRTVAPIPSAVGRGIGRAVGKKKAASDREKEKEKYLAEYGESFKERTREDAREFQKMQKEGKIPLDVKFNPPPGIATMRDYEDLWSDDYKQARERGRRETVALQEQLKRLGHDPHGDWKRKRDREKFEESLLGRAADPTDPLDPLVQEHRLREAEDAAAQRQRLLEKEEPLEDFDPRGEEPRTPEKPDALGRSMARGFDKFHSALGFEAASPPIDPFTNEPVEPVELRGRPLMSQRDRIEMENNKKTTPLPKGKGSIDPSLLPDKKATLRGERRKQKKQQHRRRK
jgi:hypothetical protein